MSRGTLRRRLLVVLVGLVVAVAASMAALSTLALRTSLMTQLDERLEQAGARAVAAQDRLEARSRWSGRGPGYRGGPPPRGLETAGQGAGTLNLTVDGDTVLAGFYADDGSVVGLSGQQVDLLRSVEPDGEPRTVGVAELGEYRVVANRSADGDLVVTGLPLAGTTATVTRYLVVEAVVGAVGIALAGLAGGALLRRELRPLDRVAATATQVSRLPLHEGEVTLAERVAEPDADPSTEVGKVGLALNVLLGHVEGALAARQASETQVRQFVADASHELRTPLASIRGYAELVRRMPAELPPDALRAMERVEAEAGRMTALVEDMLLLARLDAGRPLEQVEVDLTALAADAVADAHVAGPDHVWRLELPDPEGPDVPPTVVLGDEHRLREVLVNLLANARVHTPAGTTVTTRVHGGAERTVLDGAERTVTLQVGDDGPGIPPDVRPHLFDRFWRGDGARSPGTGSSGLGLAIVAAVVRAHDGRIEVADEPGGARFVVTFPAAAPPLAR